MPPRFRGSLRFWTVLCGLFNGRQRSLNRLHDPYGNGLMLHNLQRRSTSGLLQAITIRTLLPCAHSTGRTVHTYTPDIVTEDDPDGSSISSSDPSAVTVRKSLCHQYGATDGIAW